MARTASGVSGTGSAAAVQSAGERRFVAGAEAGRGRS